MNNYPLKLTFKISTIANDFTIKDANDHLLVYVRQKMFKFKEHIEVFGDEERTMLKYNINASKWLDFSASYLFTEAGGKQLGRVVRKGWKSIWKAHYEIFDNADKSDFLISEVNPWVRVLDGLINEIPVLNLITGYILHPAYNVTRPDGTVVAQLKKQKSLVGRRFIINKLGDFSTQEEERIMLSLMMMILLERYRG